VLCLTFSLDGRTIAISGSDGKLRLWDATTGQPRGQPIVAHQGPMLCLAFSGDGRTTATGGLDGTLRFWKAVFPTQESSAAEARQLLGTERQRERKRGRSSYRWWRPRYVVSQCGVIRSIVPGLNSKPPGMDSPLDEPR
jgi:WD40 repeat protein